MLRSARLWLSAIVLFNRKAKRLAVHLTRWTGKSRVAVHPKHLLPETETQHWYLAHLAPDMLVLDVGCGNGRHTLRAARRGARVIGLDRDEAALAEARSLSQAAGATATVFVRHDVERGLPARAVRFDAVLCLDLLEHIEARDQLLQEMRRVLRPGGVLLLGVPRRETSWKRRLTRAGLCSYADPDHKTEYTERELEHELHRNGFAVVASYPTVYDTPWIGVIDMIGGVSLTLYRWLSERRRRLAVRDPGENAGFAVVCEAR